ncbi:prepilin-type N-terminal cleavage/methylation domain-containing protein [Novispirillum sp. DQ9]|uniref:prepilin-type N-terminal cleavage/methylation domain-containing protein n=1 Tax=Novispirillum sp. DQ9 TaxID=3398612 RepID=UPI003C7C7099
MTTLARHPSADSQTARSGERGFTLIELSIVLVIIGLLIGGILQGQEMINNTRLKSTVAQVDAITAAVQTFQDKYRALPGDAPNAVSTVLGATVLGAGVANGDGIIEAAAAGAVALGTTAIANSTESAVVFNQLAAANLLQGVDNLGAGQVNSTMQAAVGNGAAFDVATFAFGAPLGNRLGVRIRTGTAAAPTAFMSSEAMFSLDQRYDDGNGITGRWRDGAGAACFTGGAYVAGAAAACLPHVSIR